MDDEVSSAEEQYQRAKARDRAWLERRRQISQPPAVRRICLLVDGATSYVETILQLDKMRRNAYMDAYMDDDDYSRLVIESTDLEASIEALGSYLRLLDQALRAVPRASQLPPDDQEGYSKLMSAARKLYFEVQEALPELLDHVRRERRYARDRGPRYQRVREMPGRAMAQLKDYSWDLTAWREGDDSEEGTGWYSALAKYRDLSYGRQRSRH